MHRSLICLPGLYTKCCDGVCQCWRDPSPFNPDAWCRQLLLCALMQNLSCGGQCACTQAQIWLLGFRTVVRLRSSSTLALVELLEVSSHTNYFHCCAGLLHRTHTSWLEEKENVQLFSSSLSDSVCLCMCVVILCMILWRYMLKYNYAIDSFSLTLWKFALLIFLFWSYGVLWVWIAEYFWWMMFLQYLWNAEEMPNGYIYEMQKKYLMGIHCFCDLCLVAHFWFTFFCMKAQFFQCSHCI